MLSETGSEAQDAQTADAITTDNLAAVQHFMGNGLEPNYKYTAD